MMKNACYFTYKALFVLKMFMFCLDFLVMYRNGLVKQIRLTSKFTTSQPGSQTILIHTLPNRSRGNQTLKAGQLIECNIGNIFLEKLYTKYGGETSPRPFSEILRLIISLDR